MGNSIAKIIRIIFDRKKDVRALILGLDAAGKTTLLYKLKLGEVRVEVPTIGFNVETIEYKNLSFTMWDIGGQAKIMEMWRYYYQGSNAVIYLVDSNDRDPKRMQLAKEALQHLMSEPELKDAALLVLANKQDLPYSMSTSEVCDMLDLQKVRGHPWFVQSSCAVSGEGVYEGLDWLSANLPKKKKGEH